MTHSLIFTFLVLNGVTCESVVLHNILLEVDRESSRFCKVTRRSKVVGPHWFNPYILSLDSFVAFHSLQSEK